jgi:hypothetical protein
LDSIDLRVNGVHVPVQSVEYRENRAVTEFAYAVGSNAQTIRDAMTSVATIRLSTDAVAKFNSAVRAWCYMDEQVRRLRRYYWALSARNRRVLRRRLARVAHEERMAAKRALGAHDRYSAHAQIERYDG